MSNEMTKAEWARDVAKFLVSRPVELALMDLEEMLRGEVDPAEEPELAKEAERLVEVVRSGKDIRVEIAYRFTVDGDPAVAATVKGEVVIGAECFPEVD